MTSRTFSRRLSRLESRRKPRLVVMWRHEDESDLAAHARWQADHPGDTLTDADLRVIVVRWTTSDERVAP